MREEMVYASTGMRDSMASMRIPSASPGGRSLLAHASRSTFTVTTSHSTPRVALPSSNARIARSPRPARPHDKITAARLALSGDGAPRPPSIRRHIANASR